MKLTAILLAICLLLIPITASAETVLYMGNIPEDAVGLWYVPCLDFSAFLYTGAWSEWQDIVDAEESMLYKTYLNAYSISDHHGSHGRADGKWLVEDIKLLSTAYLITQTETREYECYLTAVAVPDTWGYLINGKQLQPTSSTDILCRCCVGKDAERNYVALFQFVKEIR